MRILLSILMLSLSYPSAATPVINLFKDSLWMENRGEFVLPNGAQKTFYDKYTGSLLTDEIRLTTIDTTFDIASRGSLEYVQLEGLTDRYAPSGWFLQARSNFTVGSGQPEYEVESVESMRASVSFEWLFEVGDEDTYFHTVAVAEAGGSAEVSLFDMTNSEVVLETSGSPGANHSETYLLAGHRYSLTGAAVNTALGGDGLNELDFSFGGQVNRVVPTPSTWSILLLGLALAGLRHRATRVTHRVAPKSSNGSLSSMIRAIFNRRSLMARSPYLAFLK